MPDNTCAVVVTYNREKLLKQCIAFLLAQTVPCDILVVDNASTDNTAAVVNEFTDPRVSYCNTGKNFGSAGGYNIGIKKAVEAGYQYVWSMDDDTFVKPDSLAQLIEADKKLNGSYGWLASKVLWTDGSICLMNQQRITPFRKLDPTTEKITKITVSSFVSLFLKAEVVRKEGLPIKDFFIWGDDWEYTRRISRKYPCFFIPESVVTHAMANNQPNRICNASADRIERFFLLFRNEWVMFRQEGIGGWFYYCAKCNFNFWKIMFKASDKRFKRISCLLKGILQGLFFFPKIEYINKEK